MIPKIIHVCWFGPHRPPQEMIDSWEKKHSNGWLFVLWRDHRAGWENQALIDEKYKRREYNGVCDAIRYEILDKHGGFVLDADSTCQMALDEGPIDFLSNETAVACYENEAVRPGIIGCGFLGAPKGHPFFRACIADVAKQDPAEQAWKSVGPLCMGRMASQMPDQIKIYPAKMFNPTHYSGALAPGDHPIFAVQGWGSTRSYNSLRKLPCTCPECAVSMLRAPWA